jgi:hypothetical protein
VRKDGSRFWADSVLTAIRDSAGAVTGYAKVTRDFTDRKRAEEAVMLQLSNALLANMDVESCWEPSRRACARWFRTTRAPWRSTTRLGRLVVQFLGADEGEDPAATCVYR